MIGDLPVHLLQAWDEIAVWQAETNAWVEPCLSEDEQRRAESLRHPRAKQQFITGRSLLRHILAHYLDQMPNDLRFTYGPHGKPALQGGQMEFNLSHDEDCILIAITRQRPHRIGIDVQHAERIRSTEDISRMARHFFSPLEIETFSQLSPTQQQAAFWRGWVRKEAFIKAVGGGFGSLSRYVSVSLHPNEPAKLLSCPAQFGSPDQWLLYDLYPGDAYLACCAVEQTWMGQMIL